MKKHLLILVLGLSLYAEQDSPIFYEPYLNKFSNNKTNSSVDFKYKFGAQISYDGAYIDEMNEIYSNSDFRRVRAYTKGSFLNKKIFYEFEYSFTGENNYQDIYVGYKGKIEPLNTKYRFKYGNIKVPFSLEGYSSSKYITFMERSLNDTFDQSRKIAAELLFSTEIQKSYINIFNSMFSNSINEQIENETQQMGYAMRLTYGYKLDKNKLFSLGTSYMYQDISDENIKFKNAPESDLQHEKYLSVKIKDVVDLEKKNLEFLYINNKFSLQSEYAQVSLHTLKSDYSFDAYYLQGSYFILGSGRRYDLNDATLKSVKTKKEGALEIAFRYSTIDLNDKDEVGGIQSDYNYGINWYVNSELKLMLNYISADITKSDEYNGAINTIQARALFAF